MRAIRISGRIDIDIDAFYCGGNLQNRRNKTFDSRQQDGY